MSAFVDVFGCNWDGSLTTPTAATGAVTYKPSSIDQNGVATWVKDGAVYDANKKLSLSVKRPTKGSQVIRVTSKLVHPVMDAVDTTLKVGDILLTFEAVFPKRATQAERELAMGHILFFIYQNTASYDAYALSNSVY